MAIVRIKAIIGNWDADDPDELAVTGRRFAKVGTARRLEQLSDGTMSWPSDNPRKFGRVLAEITIHEEYAQHDFWAYEYFEVPGKSVEAE